MYIPGVGGQSGAKRETLDSNIHQVDTNQLGMYANIVGCCLPFLHHKVIIGRRCVNAFSLAHSDSKGNNSGLKNIQQRREMMLCHVHKLCLRLVLSRSHTGGLSQLHNYLLQTTLHGAA